MNPSESPSSRVVWITGASGGLGRRLVQQFRAQGDRVIASARKVDGLEDDPDVLLLPLDVTEPESVESARNLALARYQRVDVLINNAGIARDRLLAQMSEAEWDEVLNTNLRGAFLCSRAVIPTFIAQRSGQILNVSSLAAKKGHAGQANYVASKAGLLGLTQSLARELGPHNVQVNAIFPGVLPTGMISGLSPERIAALAAENVLGRINDLEEVSRFVWFLTTLRNVSGQTFHLDSRISSWA